MCPACLASLAVLISGGAFSAFLVAASRPAKFDVSFTPDDKGEAPGLSVLLRDGDDVFHTYSTYGRGLDILIGAYNFIDHTPRGRNEQDLKYGMEWVRHHDKY